MKSIFKTETPPGEVVRFNIQELDELVHNHGVRLVHYKGLACPIGMNDPDDVRIPHSDHSQCSNGFIYQKAGILRAAFIGNNNQNFQVDFGTIWSAQANVILDRFYEEADGNSNPGDSVPVIAAHFDRLYLFEESILVPAWERFQASQSNIQRLRYPVKTVEFFLDSKGTQYLQGIDFDVDSRGWLVWRQGRPRPFYDMNAQLGQVCSIRYLYRPYWYIHDLPHDLRVVEEENDYGDQQTVRMFQSAVLHREYFHEGSAKNDPDAQHIDDLRMGQGPANGNLPPQ